MPLPTIATPTYELELPSSGKTIKYRPFLVKEQKTLMMASESNDDKQIKESLAGLITNCTFSKIDPFKIPIFDVEFLFLRIRGKSVGEKIDLSLLCPDDNETRVKKSVNLEDIDVNMKIGHTNEINITDNTIKTTNTNADLNITPSGTGQVVIAKADINSGTVDNTVIGGTTPAAGTFTTLTASTSVTIDGITITDNTVSTNASNSPLELTGNGTGGVNISGFTFPTTDGSNGQFIKTNGSGVLSFASAGASLSYSDLADATVTIASSAATNLDTFAKADYRSAKYWISITDASNSRYEIVEANVIHDGSNAYVATFGSTTSYSAPLCTFSADISGSNVRLRVVNITSNSIVFKYQRIAIDV